MLFSYLYNLKIKKNDDWFDPILSLDTKLFIDPLLIADSKHKSFKDGNKKIITFFKKAFHLAASSSKSKSNLTYRMLLGMMSFPEVEELCLGYTSRSTKGAGSGSGYGKDIVDAIYDTIEMGIKDILILKR